MRPILFQVGHYFVWSYTAMIFLAVVAGAVTAAVRVRRVSLDSALIAKGMSIAIVLGWAVGRIGLWLDGTVRDAGLRILSPTYSAPGSLTYFLIGVFLGLVPFAILAGPSAVQYVDALAPSVLIAVAFAKIGCLLGGCCAGGVCPALLGISYPYGSPVYEHQYRAGAIVVPAALLRPGGLEDDAALWGEMQILALQPQFLAERLHAAGIVRETPEGIIDAARRQRSLAVWPVPLAASCASLVLWIAAEIVFRRSRRPGATAAFVLVGYGVLRLTFDWMIAQRGPVYFGMSGAQWVGCISLMLGTALYLTIRMRSKVTR